MAGLPKSGTTLVEEIFRFNGYLDLSHTCIRRVPRLGFSERPNELPRATFRFCRTSDRVFVKTHIEPSRTNLERIREEKISLVVVVRDLRDMMISRYFHILNSPRHPQHALVKYRSEEEGIYLSMISPTQGQVPLNYFAGWVTGWLTVAPGQVIRYEQYRCAPEQYLTSLLAGLATRRSLEENIRHLQEYEATLRGRTLRENLARRGRQRSTLRADGSRGWQNLFSPRIKNEFKRLAQATLILSGYEKDDNW